MTSVNLFPAIQAEQPAESHWQQRLRQVQVSGLHRGVDPHFRSAIRDLYFRELRLQITAIDRFNEEVTTHPLRARVKLLLRIRTTRFVRFSQTHWVELNADHSALLQELYRRVSAIRGLRNALWSCKNATEIRGRMAELDRVPTFRLMHRLGQEGLKRSA